MSMSPPLQSPPPPRLSSQINEHPSILTSMETTHHHAVLVVDVNGSSAIINKDDRDHPQSTAHDAHDPPPLISAVSRFKSWLLTDCLSDLRFILLGTKLCILFPAIPLAIIANHFHFGKPLMFASSFVGLALLAERISFLTEQIACSTGPTVGGLINASCGNATELIIAIIALCQRKIDVVKYSLLGSVLSNLLLVLGSSLFCGGLANFGKEQKYSLRQVHVNSLLLLLGLLCHAVPLMSRYAFSSGSLAADPTLQISRLSGVIMLAAYASYLFFQLKTHRLLPSVPQNQNEEEVDDDEDKEEAVVGYWSAFVWLAGLTALIALLSEYVVDAIEGASYSWGLSVEFISIILLPIVGNATEHASALIFAYRNKLDISLGVALGSATQISMFVVPLNVAVAWIVGIEMDLDFKLLGTACLAFAVVITSFALQDGTSHYMKGLILMLSYIVIAASFFVIRVHPKPSSANIGTQTPPGRMLEA
ncbi:hypothetical protein Scep_005638 [Stephania cephalantha]|uniref:Vacuolar cation/proton exchanger n=1 Tax=Stephania cephalantha TaxID=152367 RepID=A0AAP0KWD0_9MAGN